MNPKIGAGTTRNIPQSRVSKTSGAPLAGTLDARSTKVGTQDELYGSTQPEDSRETNTVAHKRSTSKIKIQNPFLPTNGLKRITDISAPMFDK